MSLRVEGGGSVHGETETLDYRIARVVEVITRMSTEKEHSPALKVYAKYLDVGERNLYKLVQRARKSGFSFGISINYDRIGMRLGIIINGSPVVANVPPKSWAKLLDGRYVYSFYVPDRCIDEFRAKAPGDKIYLARISWGSRPALTSIPFLYADPDVELDRTTVEGMRRVFKEVYREGPRGLEGRRYPTDRLTVLMLMEMSRDALRSIASLAKEYGINPIKAQRKYYRLWKRRAVIGYRVKCAPYYSKTGIIALVRHHDPERLAYALPVLPPVAAADVIEDEEGRSAVLVQAFGGDAVHAVFRIIREEGGVVEEVYPYHSPKTPKPEEIAKAYKAEVGAPVECPVFEGY